MIAEARPAPRSRRMALGPFLLLSAVALVLATAGAILLGEIAQFLGHVMPPMPEFQRKLCA